MGIAELVVASAEALAELVGAFKAEQAGQQLTPEQDAVVRRERKAAHARLQAAADDALAGGD